MRSERHQLYITDDHYDLVANDKTITNEATTMILIMITIMVITIISTVIT